MGAGWAWARSELRRGRRANVALVMLIALSGAVVLTAAAGARRTDSAFRRFMQTSNLADVQVQYSTEADVDQEVEDAFRAHPDVEVVAPLYFTFGANEASDYDLLIVSGPDPALFRQIDRPRVLEGRVPDPAAADEVLINPFVQEDLGVRVGDRIELETFAPETDFEDPSSEPIPGPTADVEVVGIGTLPYDAADDTFGLIVATPAYYEQYATRAMGFGPSLDVTVRDGADAESVAEEVAEPFAFDELFLSPAEDLEAKVHDGTRALVVGLWAFTGVAGVAFLIACAQATRRRLEATDGDQLALRSVGLGRVDRALAATMTVVPMVVVGCALAALVAIPASALMPIGAPGRAEPDPGIHVDLTVLAGGALALAVVLLLAAVWASARIVHPRSTAAGRGSAIVAGAAPAQLVRTRLGPVESLGVTMALDPDSQRGRVPVRSAFLGAVLGAAGLAGVLTFGAGLDALVHEPARSGWNWTLRIDPFDDEVDAIASLDGVEHLGRLSQRQVVIEGDAVNGGAMSSITGSPSFTIVRGRMPAADEEVALGPALADRIGRGVGDRVTLTGPDGEDVRKVVVGLALLPTFDDDVAFNESVALTLPELDRLAHSDGEGNDATLVTFDEDISYAEAAARVTSVAPEAVSVYSYPVLPTDVANLDDVRPLPRALAIFLALLGLAAIAHALATSVHRRRRELGTVRSLGFVARQVQGAVTVQSATMVVVGLLAGVPLGIVVGRTAWRAVAEGLGVVSTPTVPVPLLAAVVPAAVLAGIVVAWYPGRMARRGVALDALRSE
jgi:ABC-type lipoprotein release transport system permease subunit